MAEFTVPIDLYQPELQGSYQFIYLEEIVNNFLQIYTGDSTILGKVQRKQVIMLAKRGIQEMNYNTLKALKVVELDLSDNCDIIKPYDYVGFSSLNWLDRQTGQFRPLALNRRTDTAAVSFLQDNLANILFDDDGYVLEGTSATEVINNNLPIQQPVNYPNGCNAYYCAADWDEGQLWSTRTDQNANGTYNETDTRFHFSSNVASETVILVYVSDGLYHSDDSRIRINKLAEDALYAFINDRLLANRPSTSVSGFDKQEAKKRATALMGNAKIRLSGITIAQLTGIMKQQNSWIK